MAKGLGWKGGIVGFGEESTWGVAVTPTKFLEVTEGAATKEIEQIHTNALPKPYRIKEDFAQGMFACTQEFTVETRYEGIGLLLKHMLGEVNTTTPITNVYEHVFKLADELPVGLTMEYHQDLTHAILSGAKITGGDFSIDVNNFLLTKINATGKDIVYGSGTTATLPTSDLIVFHQGLFKYNAVETNVTTATININNNLKEDSQFIGSQTISEPCRIGKFEITGTFKIEFENMTQVDDYLAATTRELILEFVGAEFETSHNYTLRFTMPNIRVINANPNPADSGVIMLELSYVAYATDSAGRELEVYLKNAVPTI